MANISTTFLCNSCDKKFTIKTKETYVSLISMCPFCGDDDLQDEDMINYDEEIEESEDE